MASSWTVGQKIRSDEELWEVTRIFPEVNELCVRPLEMSSRMEQFIDYDKEYRLELLRGLGCHELRGVWRVPVQDCKQQHFNVMLWLWNEGPEIDLEK